MKTVQSDDRFVHITNCEIRSLYRKIPKDFGGFLINIAYKDKDDDLFHQTMQIEIDCNKLGKDLLSFTGKKDERLYYTNGMTDIDIYKQGDKYVIYWSPNHGKYVYFFFSKQEFEKLKQWLSIEFNEK